MQGGEVWEELCRLGRERSFAAGAHMTMWGADERGVVAIVTGVCKVVNTTSEGREALATVRGPGEVLGEIAALTGSPRSSSVIALSPVEAVLVNGAEFDRWLDEAPGAGRKLATLLAVRLAETTRFGIAARLRVDTRVADRILFLVDRFAPPTQSSQIELETSLTHEDLAAWVGATRAVTTRAMGALRDRGLLDFGRGWIRVPDRPALEAFCLAE
ncbi:Crp/Fnr family transcriptional regulator [Actinospongicola halichondriae]|uniref:Crp/Fnr family transcriptional regulator n=1 Tax=Actinospongicola halichondriae TaxID=3236844 RepID=UPI003D399018